MNDVVQDVRAGHRALNASAARAFHDRLDDPITGSDLLAELRACEELKNAPAARQARLAVAVHDEQRARDVPRGITKADTARQVGSQVALARRCAPHLGSRLLGLAHAVVEEMPHTRRALTAGVITEWDATVLCRETACLTREDRAAVDAAVADQLGTVSHQRLEGAVRDHAYRADPEAVTARRARAESERRVSLRPAPDCMTRLSALLPVKDGVACFAALSGVADATATAGHPRGQVMADTLVERVTGRASMNTKPDAGDQDPAAAPTRAAAATSCDAAGAPAAAEQPDTAKPDTYPDSSQRSEGPAKPGVRVNLVMPLDTLTGDVPAYVPGYGPIPADLARAWVMDPDQEVEVRRLFSFPGTGDLLGMDSRSRTYPGLLATLIRLRDQTCRTPFCDAPIRHTDHIRSHATGGATCERNGQGLCERCNYVKEHPDHHVTGDATETVTATGGLVAVSHPPAPPGMPPPTRSYVERSLMDITWTHYTVPPDQATNS